MQLTTSTTHRPCGIFWVLQDRTEAYLPLERADIHVDVVDVSAIVTVTQQYWQCSPLGLKKAKYIFPVPARAAVCGFEMTTEDGTVITAVAKEKEEAKREHEQAIAQGFMTGLVEHVTDDVFSISLGALPSHQMIQVQITYVLDLMEEDVTDSVRVQIPMSIGMRYGRLPDGMQDAQRVPPHRISISADVRMQGAVKSVTSSSHPTVTVLNSDVPHAQRSARYVSSDFLAQDFVLSIKAEGLDAPRCFAQKAKNGATAIQLNVVPKFNLPSVPRQEYVFLVDRSGSMNGDRIEMAKKALVMLLRALPSQGTHFNIFSFGSHCDSLWPQSIPYDGESLNSATAHVDTMWANYGGTEMNGALEQVFRSRKNDTPTACFVLTDGETYNIDQTISTVDKAVKQAASSAPLRVFTLGIGSTTSSAMCEGIARAGNGVCLMSTTSEGIIGKCSKLVRASRTYVLKNVSVDWGVRNDLAEAYRTGNTTLKGVQQAPAQVSAIYPGNRFIVFALIDDPAYTPPNEVVIRAQRDGQGEVLQFSVPIQVVEFPADHPHARLIPTLAARRRIMDLEDGARDGAAQDVKPAVVALGTEYQLASRYTSFVAVDKRTHTELPAEPELTRQPPVAQPFGALRAMGMSFAASPQNHQTQQFFGAPMAAQAQQQMQAQQQLQSRATALNVSAFGQPAMGATSAFGQSAMGATSAFGQPAMGTVSAFGQRAMSASSAFGQPALRTTSVFGASSPGSFSSGSSGGLFGSSASPPPPPPPTMSAAFGSFGAARSPPAAPAPLACRAPLPAPAPPAPQLFSLHGGMMPRGRHVDRNATGAAAGPDEMDVDATEEGDLATEAKVLKLIRLQEFDGSFPPVATVEKIIGKPCLGEAANLQVDQKAWVTALAIAYLREHMKDQPELLDGLVEKVMEYLQSVSGIDVGALLARAEAFVQ
ncbi:von Willebrand domain-containing protein [Phanerochaete sordida]|uniref:von Willebrand domain-containing protein n=1 Tax=Phanerochaete sordida TaxID=48140 RepID=A0A9P3GEZ3_9APHY|nr:von Willebrand domain-containing protein [Phanerochaete sordida]